MPRYFMGGTRLESFEKMMMSVPTYRDPEEESEETCRRQKRRSQDEEAEDELQSGTE